MNTFSHPEKIVEDLPIFSGQKVADFGAGKGTYTFLLAQKVKSSPEGMVFAIEIQKQLVDYIAQEAKEKGLTNVKAVWGDVDDPGGSRLRDESVQVVLVANTLFQVEKRSELIKEAKRVLTKKGMLVVIDWSESFGNIGPHEEQVVTQQAAQVLLKEHGFEIERKFNAGEHHYGIITYKN